MASSLFAVPAHAAGAAAAPPTAAAPAPSAAPELRSGWVVKQGKHGHRWQQRWLQLTPQGLCYLAQTRSGLALRGTIALAHITAVLPGQAVQPPGRGWPERSAMPPDARFAVDTAGGRRYFFLANHGADAQAWMRAIRQAMDHSRAPGPAGPPGQPTSPGHAATNSTAAEAQLPHDKRAKRGLLCRLQEAVQQHAPGLHFAPHHEGDSEEDEPEFATGGGGGLAPAAPALRQFDERRSSSVADDFNVLDQLQDDESDDD